MPLFSIHPQLLTDSHRLGRFPHSHLLLHKNALLPWFILVPKTTVTGLFELEPAIRLAIMEESALVGRFIPNPRDFCRRGIHRPIVEIF